MIDKKTLAVNLCESVRDFSSKLNASYPAVRVICINLNALKVGIYKGEDCIKSFDFSNISLNEWPALEHDLWYFLTDLILDLSLERQSEYNEDIPF